MTAPALALPPGVTLPPVVRLLKAAQTAQSTRADNATLKLSATLYAGDLWAGGLGWSGPRPDPLNDRTPGNAVKVAAEIERTFVSRNLAKDVVDRHQSGVAGREPLWNAVPRREREALPTLSKEATPAERSAHTAEVKRRLVEDRRAREYSSALTDWWEESGAWLAVQQAVRTALVTERGTVRLYLHDSALDDITDAEGKPARGIRRGLTLSEAARRISVHAPRWDQAGVTRDRDGHVTGAYHHWTDDQDRARWEVHERVGGKTVVHPDLLLGGTDNLPAVTYPVPDLLVYELHLDTLLTPSLRRLLAAANKTLTMGSRNIDLGGFVERTILNAQMPGVWKDDPTAPDGKRFVPDNYNVGAGASNFLSGIAVMQRNDKGKMVPTGQFATPSIVYKDPTAYDVFKMSFDQLREAILDEANQLHVLIAGDASASGVSRQQAVNDFLSSLEPTRIALEGLLRWLLETVLRLALYFTGREGEADDMRVRAQARISAVQPTPAEIKTALELHQAGTISLETFHARIGVEDSAAERERIAAEGITPAIAMQLVEKAPTWIGVRALQIVYAQLGITDAHVQAHFLADTAGAAPPVDAANLDDPDADPEDLTDETDA